MTEQMQIIIRDPRPGGAYLVARSMAEFLRLAAEMLERNPYDRMMHGYREDYERDVLNQVAAVLPHETR